MTGDGRPVHWAEVTVTVTHEGGRFAITRGTSADPHMPGAPDVPTARDVLEEAVKDARAWLRKNPPPPVRRSR